MQKVLAAVAILVLAVGTGVRDFVSYRLGGEEHSGDG